MPLPTLSLTPVQALATSAARAVEAFAIDGQHYLAVAQMAMDIPGQPPSLNGGSSDTTLPIYRWQDGQFALHQELRVAGGEDAEFFQIGDQAFLATASIRSGDGPYEMNVVSTLYVWRDGRFEPFQHFHTFAAKQWRHFEIDGRHFLALAQGVALPGIVATHPAASSIYAWNGQNVVLFQEVESAWGYNWQHVQIDGLHLLAYADHVAPSQLLRWSGSRFEAFQTLEEKSGRAFSFFQHRGSHWMAVANLLGESALYRWADGRFARQQTLCGPGARELLWLPAGDGGGWLLQANFLLGSREAPQPMAASSAYRFDGEALLAATPFASSGAVDLASFAIAGQRYLAVANCVAPDMRFRTDTLIYRINGDFDDTHAQSGADPAV